MRRLVVSALLLAAACSSKMAKIEGIRDALVADDASAIAKATEGYPTCPDAPPVVVMPGAPSPRDKGCLSEIANALGSTRGFSPQPPDQAAAATAALVLTREGRGDLVAHVDLWLGAMKGGSGAGLDALRLAVARKMAEAAPLVGRKIEEEKDAVATMKAVASAIPGTCPTYWLLGSGQDNAKLAPELTSEHAACVQRDLQRREGPGGSYGDGIFRALEGSLSEWREAERALRLGLTHASPASKAVLEKKLAIIQDATQKIATKKIAATAPVQALVALGDMHADAGIPLWKPRDAGADATATPGPPPLKFTP